MRRRRLQEKKRHREEILAAALRLFAEKGYHRTSMQEIAQEADFAVGTLYRFFPSKKALYEALVLEEAGAFHQEMMKAFEDLPEDPLAALVEIIRHRLLLVQKHWSFIKMYFAELWEARLRRGLTKELEVMFEEYLEALARTLAPLSPPGVTPRQLAVVVDALFSALVFEALEKRRPLPEAEEVVKLLTQPILRGNHVNQT